jgi:RNA polymerase sigma-70 factor (ECF subfamily)
VTADLSEAEDIAQECFIRFFRARTQNEPVLQPRAWIFRVAHNLLVDQGRKKKPELLDEDAWLRIEDRFLARPGWDARVELSQLPWHRLSPMELSCLRLRAEDLKFREIGEVLDLSVSSVVSYISRAIKKLRTAESEGRETPQPRRAAPAL